MARKAVPLMSLVVRDASDRTRDYYMPTEAAALAFQTGELGVVSVYNGRWDPHGRYYKNVMGAI